MLLATNFDDFFQFSRTQQIFSSLIWVLIVCVVVSLSGDDDDNNDEP